MQIRAPVARLIALGQLPSGSAATSEKLQVFEAALSMVPAKLTEAEVCAVVKLFPLKEDSCFGLAWSLVHLVESASSWPNDAALTEMSGPWKAILLERLG
jgi:hypothetical protein